MSLTHKEVPYPHWEYVQPNTFNRIRVVPERGGLVTEWRCNDREILYFDLKRFGQIKKSIRGGIPVLFPICGDLPDGLLKLPKGDFQIGQHGFARDLPWQINLLEDQTGISLNLSDNEITQAVYPYSFMIEMQCCLKESRLEIRTKIQNLSEVDMPFSFGLHPYFNVSNLQKTHIEGLSAACYNHLEMSESQTCNQLEHLSAGIDFLTTASGPVTLVDLAKGDRLQLHQQEPMNLTVVWTDPPRQMVCLEPWTSPRNSLNSGERLLLLQPGGSHDLSCSFDAS